MASAGSMQLGASSVGTDEGGSKRQRENSGGDDGARGGDERGNGATMARRRWRCRHGGGVRFRHGLSVAR
ncbi:hypothetical protein Syun_031037 [Stephania yunnanensis]|uniref:Uncharacterized protein n=1 Tax=Stephania yunnanensis TaxID=152371 RepID=A0AAP0DVJ8_9MAGN